MVNMQLFKKYLQLSDQLINLLTKEYLAESARLLAINIVHYESVHGTFIQILPLKSNNL